MIDRRLIDVKEGLIEQKRTLLALAVLADLVKVLFEVSLQLLLEDLEVLVAFPRLVDLLSVQSHHLYLEVIDFTLFGDVVADYQFIRTRFRTVHAPPVGTSVTTLRLPSLSQEGFCQVLIGDTRVVVEGVSVVEGYEGDHDQEPDDDHDLGVDLVLVLTGEYEVDQTDKVAEGDSSPVVATRPGPRIQFISVFDDHHEDLVENYKEVEPVEGLQELDVLVDIVDPEVLLALAHIAEHSLGQSDCRP